MRLSLQVSYAICGIFDLAYNGQGAPVQVRVIGERQQIPARYLEQIFQRLRRARLVSGKRGPGGGYTLLRSPREITLRDIVEAVEGPIGKSRSRARRRGRPGPDERELPATPEVGPEGPPGGADAGDLDLFRPDFLWDDLSERFARVLAEITLEALCQRAARSAVRRSGEEAHTYQI